MQPEINPFNSVSFNIDETNFTSDQSLINNGNKTHLPHLPHFPCSDPPLIPDISKIPDICEPHEVTPHIGGPCPFTSDPEWL